MPVTYEIDRVHRVVIVTVSGEVTDAGLFKIYDDLRANADAQSDFAVLIDLRQAVGRSVTSTGVEALAQRSTIFSREARRAVVLPSDFGRQMARMYGALRGEGSASFSIFDDLAEAKRWVGIEGE